MEILQPPIILMSSILLAAEEDADAIDMVMDGSIDMVIVLDPISFLNARLSCSTIEEEQMRSKAGLPKQWSVPYHVHGWKAAGHTPTPLGP